MDEGARAGGGTICLPNLSVTKYFGYWNTRALSGSGFEGQQRALAPMVESGTRDEGIIPENVKALTGFRSSIVSLPYTDVRLWRGLNNPAYLYGTNRFNVAMADEYVDIDELVHVLKVHALSAYD